MSETAISARFQEAMDRLGVYCERLNSSSKRAGIKVKGGRLHLCSPGTPDRLVIRNGITVFVEFKRPGEVPTADQLKQHARIARAGVRVLVETDSAEAVRRVLAVTRTGNE